MKADWIDLWFQDLMNREKKNKIPSMQVGFIDAICLQLYEVRCLKKDPSEPEPELSTVACNKGRS